MIIAALDTSGATASFAVEAQDNIVVQLDGLVLGRKSAELFPALQTALADADLTWESIRSWTVGMGPGSFTGIRIGAAFVQGICAATKAACAGVPSSLAMARTGGENMDQTLAVMNDGRRGEMIISAYERAGGDWQPAGPPAPIPVGEISTLRQDRLVISAADRALDSVPAEVADRLVTVPGIPAARLLHADSLADPAMEPVYVRPAVFVPPSLPA